MTATVKDGQSLFDIALLAAGTAEAVFDIAAANNVGVGDELPMGAALGIPAVANKETVTHYTINKLAPATGIGNTPAESALLEEGIECWLIEYDFVVDR